MEENNQNKEPLNKDFKVPKLRFKEFNKPWKNENFSSLFQYIPTNSLSWDALNYICGSLRNLHYGIIHSNTNEILSAVSLPFINNCFVPKKYIKAIPGDLFLADTSEDRKDCGKGIEINGLTNHAVVGGLHTMHIRDKHSLFVPFYKALFTRSNTFHKFAYKYSEGIKVFSLKPSLFKYLDFYYPEKLEQQKIVDLFEYIDTKIAILEKKIEALKKYRKGIIHYLIKEGSLASKIKNLVRVEKKTGLASSYGKDIGSYPFFINNDEGIEKYCDEYAFDGQYLILNTGGTASVKYYDGKFSAMSDCLILRPIEHAIGLYYFLVANEKKINIAGFQGTGLKHLDQKWFFNLKAILPNLSDAELNKLNELTKYQIENLKKKAQLMKSFKQYLLANMFI